MHDRQPDRRPLGNQESDLGRRDGVEARFAARPASLGSVGDDHRRSQQRGRQAHGPRKLLGGRNPGRKFRAPDHRDGAWGDIGCKACPVDHRGDLGPGRLPRQHAHAVIARVDHDHPLVGGRGEPAGTAQPELSCRSALPDVAPAPESGDRCDVAVCRDPADRVVPRVGDVEGVAVADSHSARGPEFSAGGRPAISERSPVSGAGDRDKHASGIDHQHSVIGPVRHVDPAHGIHGDVAWPPQWRFRRRNIKTRVCTLPVPGDGGDDACGVEPAYPAVP